MSRTCAAPGCNRSLDGRRASTRYCSGRCRTRACRDRQEAASDRYVTGGPSRPTPAVTGPPVTAWERRSQRRQKVRERARADLAWLVDHDPEVKELLLETVRRIEERGRRAEIHERAMTIRPRLDQETDS